MQSYSAPISDVTSYTHALSDAEVKQVYQRGRRSFTAMQPYAILSADLQSVIEVKLIDPTTIEKFRSEGNAKALRIRDAVEGTKPTPSSTQVVIPTGWEIGELIATRTYGLRDKTPEEIEAETKAATRDALIAGAIADFNLALTNWAGLSAAQQKAVLKRCVQVLIAMLRNELTQ